MKYASLRRADIMNYVPTKDGNAANFTVKPYNPITAKP